MRWTCVYLVVLIAGCGDTSSNPDAAAPDLVAPDSAAPDLAMPDLATPDLTTPDLATPDLVTPDLAMPDLATPDLATPDLVIPPDLMPAPGAALWAKIYGDANNQIAGDVAVDPASGHIAVTGTFSGSIDFGGGALTAVDGTDMFVAVLDASGQQVWAKRYNGAPQAIAFDPSGNLLVTGRFGGSTDFGTGSVMARSASGDDFVAKLDPTGKGLWTQTITSTSTTGLSQTGWAVRAAPGAGGAVYLVGTINGYTTLAGANLNYGLFAAKLDPSTGEVLAARGFGNIIAGAPPRLAIDAAGNLALVGSFNGTLNFGGGALTTPPSSYDVYVASLDGTLAHRWSKSFDGGGTSGNPSISSAHDVAIDAANDVVVAGDTGGTLDFGGGPLASPASYAPFIAVFTSSGSYVRAKAWPNGSGYAVAVDASGDFYLTGGSGGIDFGGGPLPATGIYLVKLTPTFNEIWGQVLQGVSWGNSIPGRGGGIAVDAQGGLAYLANVPTKATIGPFVLTAAGPWDVVVARFAP